MRLFSHAQCAYDARLRPNPGSEKKNFMRPKRIVALAIPIFLAISVAQNTHRVEMKDVTPVQRFEQVISGHVAELNGKYKFRVSEVTYQPGGYVGDHNHAGPGVRVIMAGEFTYVKGDKTIVYKAGDAFFEPGDMTHRAYNRGSMILKVMNVEILPADYSGSALIPPTP